MRTKGSGGSVGLKPPCGSYSLGSPYDPKVGLSPLKGLGVLGPWGQSGIFDALGKLISINDINKRIK